MNRRLTVWNPWRMVPRDAFDWDDWGFAEYDDVQMDLYEEKDDIIVKLKAPGFGKDDINIQIESNTITVTGNVKEERKEDDSSRKYYKKEIRSMSFSRSAELPTMVKADSANAKFQNGILTITLPKSEEVKPKTIDIDVVE